jgi:hypothetical protein
MITLLSGRRVLGMAQYLIEIVSKWLHRERDARLVLHNQLQHHLVEVRPMKPAIPSGDVNDLGRGLLIAVVAPIDMKARAIEMGKAGCKAQALGSRRGQKALEFRHPVSIERI